MISDLAMWRKSIQPDKTLEGYRSKIFNTFYETDSIRFIGAVLWNFVSDYLNDSHNFQQFIRKVTLDLSFRERNFNCLSVQSVPKKKMCAFMF